MSLRYYKCKRCGEFYAEDNDTILSLGAYDPDLSDTVTLCERCFKLFKDFVKGFVKTTSKESI